MHENFLDLYLCVCFFFYSGSCCCLYPTNKVAACFTCNLQRVSLLKDPIHTLQYFNDTTLRHGHVHVLYCRDSTKTGIWFLMIILHNNLLNHGKPGKKDEECFLSLLNEEIKSIRKKIPHPIMTQSFCI